MKLPFVSRARFEHAIEACEHRKELYWSASRARTAKIKELTAEREAHAETRKELERVTGLAEDLRKRLGGLQGEMDSARGWLSDAHGVLAEIQQPERAAQEPEFVEVYFDDGGSHFACPECGIMDNIDPKTLKVAEHRPGCSRKRAAQEDSQ